MTTNQTPIIRLDHVSKHYGDAARRVTALDDVSVDIGAGEFTAVMGPSGSGKSTLMHVAAGLDAVSSGRISIDGVEITDARWFAPDDLPGIPPRPSIARRLIDTLLHEVGRRSP